MDSPVTLKWAAIVVTTAVFIVDGSGAHKHRRHGEHRQDKQPSLSELDDIAVVLIGGEQRLDWALAAQSTWLSMFSKTLYVTSTDPDESVMGKELAAITLNVFKDTPTQDDQIEKFIHPSNPFLRHIGRQKKSNTHDLGWHLAQPRYLLGLQALVQRFPTAKWYFIADSDTFVFPRRFARGLLRNHNPDSEAIGLGTRWMQRIGPGNTMQACLLGGAGAVLSTAAIQQMNISECVRKQDSILRWNKLASDWRLAECMRDGDVEISAAEFMLMVNDQFTCEPHGPSDCGNFYARIHRTRTACPYTYHYMAPSNMTSIFNTQVKTVSDDQVCLPLSDGKCECKPSTGVAT